MLDIQISHELLNKLQYLILAITLFMLLSQTHKFICRLLLVLDSLMEETRSGRDLQIVRCDDSTGGMLVTNQSHLDLFINHPNLARADKVALLALTGDEQCRDWKGFVANGLMEYLGCAGVGNWFGSTWAARNQYKVYCGNESQPLSDGIYLWSEPFILENSRGESVAVVLMDVIHGGNPGLELLVAKMSTTLIFTKTGARVDVSTQG